MMQEIAVALDETDGYDSFDDQYNRPTERWAPLGATSPEPSGSEMNFSGKPGVEAMQEWEDEQEELNQSLFALTSHFAQVQLRLKQIVQAPPEDKEHLLSELEQFAFKGVPDMGACQAQVEQVQQATAQMQLSEGEHDKKMKEQREKQQHLIVQLKEQLQELESYAYETGARQDLPTNEILEKQTAVIEELQKKLDVPIDAEFSNLSPAELKQLVDTAIGQIVNPAKVKEKLVDQLKTQIVDLERFISFLQGEATSPGPLGTSRCTCTCPVHKGGLTPSGAPQGPCPTHGFSGAVGRPTPGQAQTSQQRTASRIWKLAQLFIVTQFGCGVKDFERNLLKKTPKANHWGDLRAAVEVSIEKAHKLALGLQEKRRRLSQAGQEPEEVPEGEDEEGYIQENTDRVGYTKARTALTAAVRKQLAPAIRDLVHHGMGEVSSNTSLVPLGCFSGRSARAHTQMSHVWHLLLKYYDMKHGRQYNESPARKLSQAFDLDMVGGKAITPKQTLLSAIDTVLTTHIPGRKGDDSCFKAFICIGLNERKLAVWLRMLFRTQAIVDTYYQGWSYVARTGFEDCCKSLEQLQDLHFDLPVDLAVRNLKKLKDAF